MTRVTFSIPGIPRGQGRPRFAHGRAYKAAADASTETTIAILAKAAMAGREPIEGPCRVTVTAVYPIAASWPKKRREAAGIGDERPTRKPDCDNILKSVADGMNGIVYGDDAQIVQASVRKDYGSGLAVGVHVVVEAI